MLTTSPNSRPIRTICRSVMSPGIFLNETTLVVFDEFILS